MKLISQFAARAAAFGIGLFLIGFALAAHAAPTVYTGVNLAGADFGENNLPGVYNTHYTYPTRAEVDYFTGKGMNTFRLPFRWERLQQSPNAQFDAAEQARIDEFVNYATGRGAFVILDPHNYARYYGNVIGQGAVPASRFADFWTRLANRYKTNSRVIFGLMNEPHDMPTELWRDAANTAIAAIRATGAANLILVPGNGYTGAHSWLQNWYGTPNGTVMLSITDPGNNFAFDVHQYLDGNFSGSSETCTSQTVGAEKLVDFTRWLRQNNRRGFLGEFGGGRNNTCYAALDNMLDYVDANRDVWLGWTYWAAGPWWGEYIFTIEPTGCPSNCTDRPQMTILREHLLPPSVAPNRTRFDFDGDGRADVAVFRPENGVWYVNQSGGGLAARQFGAGGDQIVPGDYDGDGKTDLAVFRKNADSTWYILQSSNNTFRFQQWGATNQLQAILFDTPAPGDYDGDGKTDFAVWRLTDFLSEPARFLILQSSSNTSRTDQWGGFGDALVPAADYDADGKADFAVYRGGIWYLNQSTGGSRAVQFGASGDKLVPADYDADGKTDIAVFRPSNGVWYLNQSQAGFKAVQFGAASDRLVPADYDADGKTDVAVYRDGIWYLNRTADGFTGIAFGVPSDKPIPNAYLR